MMKLGARRAVLARLICALALVMLGFSGHAEARQDIDPVGFQYELPDGSFASLCQPSDEKGDTHGSGHRCDICVMSAGHLFTPPDALVLSGPLRAVANPVFWRGDGNAKPIRSHHGQSRAPPLAD